MLNIEQEVFAIRSFCFTSAALSEFFSLPRIDRSGKVPFIRTINRPLVTGLLCESDKRFFAIAILSMLLLRILNILCLNRKNT